MEFAVIMAVWFAFASLVVGRLFIDPDRTARPPITGVSDVTWRMSIYLLWALFTPLIFWLSSRTGLGPARSPGRIGLHLLSAIAIAAVMDAYGDVVYRYLLRDPGERKALSAIASSSLSDVVRLGFLWELIFYAAILAVGFARDYYRRFQERQMQAAHLQAQLTEARLDALRMQINPHFLFNTLHAISSMVERDPSGVRKMVARLSALLRHTLDHDGAQETTLARELDVLDDYLAIMQVRFEHRLTIRKDVDPEVRDAMVPDMILQPIVENAIKHGVTQRSSPGWVEIAAVRTGGHIELSVEDNGPGIALGDDPPQGVGLSNVRSRIDQMYGDDATLWLSNGREGGVRATLSFPYHTQSTFDNEPLTPPYDAVAHA
jgi:signal transduction histidine kinase